jgi:hypothetical protein
MQQTAYACYKLRQVNSRRHERANTLSMLREFWPRREQNLNAETLMPSHQSQGDAVRFPGGKPTRVISTSTRWAFSSASRPPLDR